MPDFKLQRETSDRAHIRARRPQNFEVSRDLELAESVITSLSFKQREVFVLYELEEMEGPEITELLNIPIGTVWTRLHKAREIFQAKLEKKKNAGAINMSLHRTPPPRLKETHKGLQELSERSFSKNRLDANRELLEANIQKYAIRFHHLEF